MAAHDSRLWRLRRSHLLGPARRASTRLPREPPVRLPSPPPLPLSHPPLRTSHRQFQTGNPQHQELRVPITRLEELHQPRNSRNPTDAACSALVLGRYPLPGNLAHPEAPHPTTIRNPSLPVVISTTHTPRADGPPPRRRQPSIQLILGSSFLGRRNTALHIRQRRACLISADQPSLAVLRTVWMIFRTMTPPALAMATLALMDPWQI